MANPFVHVELNSTDIGKSKSFYTALFDWKLTEEKMGGDAVYTMIGVGEGTGGGMMTHPMPGAPSMWLPYVLVPDIRAATDKARTLGAQIIRDAMEVPDAGTLSILIDPTGATIGLWQPKGR